MAEEHLDALQRLQILQRDLLAFAESRQANLERLATQLDASAEDFRRLLHRNKKKEASRAVLAPANTSQPSKITINDVEYQIEDQFRQSALQVADDLDLDELESAELCIKSQNLTEGDHSSRVLCMRAVLRFHEQRQALLDCLRMLLQLSLDSDADDLASDAFRDVTRQLIRGELGGDDAAAAYWHKCMDGMLDIEAYLKKVSEHKNALVVTGQGLHGENGDFLVAQRLLLTRQHESLASVLTYLIRGSFVGAEQFKGLLSRAASLEADFDITIHYLPVLVSGAASFAADNPDEESARTTHNLLANGQLQWKQPKFKAAAIVLWLAQYAARFSGAPDPNRSEAERQGVEGAQSKLFSDALKGEAFHFVLAAAASFKPVVWHDPARSAIIGFLINDLVVMPSEAPRPSDDFSALTMRELQVFADAFVTNMPDALRRLKTEEDDKRRNVLSQLPGQAEPQTEFDLERFMIIMACAYQDDADAANEIWFDPSSHVYGFLRWASQRLPTPRIAAFCQLLRCLAGDDKSATKAHQFLLQDGSTVSGKLRRVYAVSWTQIFSELELYASSLKERPSAPESSGQERASDLRLYETETSIMLDAYLGLAAHICRTSPSARNWLLRDQPFHLGEVMFQLARSASDARIRACCLDLLAALLTDQSLEVRNGIWVLLDSWISSGGLDGSSAPRVPGRPQYPAKQYLQAYANSGEAGLSMVTLLNALTAPPSSPSEASLDALPFPEHLGAPHRHAGIDSYVDFIMDAVFARKLPLMIHEGEALVNLVRYECLRFVVQCLESFNEDLVLLANTTSVGVESAMQTKSLAAYARLHPFARVMGWMFDRGVLISLFGTLQQNLDALDDAESRSPMVQATLKSLQALSLAWKLQPTYFGLVRPTILSQSSKSQPLALAYSSIDEMLLANLNVVLDVAHFTTSRHVEISLESLHLLQRIASSRKLTETTDTSLRGRQGTRIISVLAPICPSLTVQLAQDFFLQPWDFESTEIPLKVVKAKALLDLLNASLDVATTKSGLAHALLGFHCQDGTVEILPQSPFAFNNSLFHAITNCAAQAPIIGETTNTHWLLSLKRGCLAVVLKIARSPLTAQIIQPQLRSMDFLAAASQNQAPAAVIPFCDNRSLLDGTVLLENSAAAIRDFMHVREAFFEIAATDLRSAAEQGSFSIQEKIVSMLLGTIRLPTGEQLPTLSIFEAFDFFDLETSDAFVVPKTTFFDNAEVSNCTKDDPEIQTAFDIEMAEELLVLRKRELKEKGTVKDGSDTETADNEIRAILAALTSQNNFAAILNARLDALEAWTDLLSLVIGKGGLEHDDLVALSLQGLLVILPKFEKSLADNLDAATLLAKLTLTFTQGISPASQAASEQTADVAIERLLSTFRVSLRVLTDSSTDLVLRDVSYRTTCAILVSILKVPPAERTTQTASVKQLFQLVQHAGERLFTVVTEDAFSGRGVTRVSALLFLDGMVRLFQGLKMNASMLRALTKLNFIPLLVDTSIGSVSSAFKGDDETAASLAYVHSALALLLRVCQTPDGTQLVLNSGLFQGIEDSKLFSTDPDLGLDIDNTAALKAFHAILADALRLITAVVVQKGRQPGISFLHQNRFTVQAIFKQASKGLALNVAEELERLILATGFLEEDESAPGRLMTNGFS